MQTEHPSETWEITALLHNHVWIELRILNGGNLKKRCTITVIYDIFAIFLLGRIKVNQHGDGLLVKKENSGHLWVLLSSLSIISGTFSIIQWWYCCLISAVCKQMHHAAADVGVRSLQSGQRHFGFGLILLRSLFGLSVFPKKQMTLYSLWCGFMWFFHLLFHC